MPDGNIKSVIGRYIFNIDLKGLYIKTVPGYPVNIDVFFIDFPGVTRGEHEDGRDESQEKFVHYKDFPQN